ncbi:MAG: glycine cleavage system aminomethyltransferase GcvT [Porticoccaceae bacterium]|nr:glycine cleavage system aminomethyltransferase GcvT [Porticoccaceae bacterium]
MLLRTSLYSAHQKLAAKLVDFGGWEMPLHYGSQIAEHHSVRRQCGMFDVSHMTIVDVLGSGARAYLHYLLANDVDKLSGDRQALYSLMLNEAGGVIDDLMIYMIDKGFRLVVNCATRVKDLAWMEAQAGSFDVTVTERDDMAMLAIQGPEAIAKVQTVLRRHRSEHDSLMIAQLPRFGAVVLDQWHYARTGYTGEDGLEVMLPASQAEAFWWQLHEVGVAPAGLGARDTLRLEAGLNLYGHEMDEQTSPLEANLAWTIAWQPEDRNFVGRAAVTKARERGVHKKLVGVLMTERGVLRAQQSIYCGGIESPDTETSTEIGIVTSGSFSPTLGYSVGLARVDLSEAGSSISDAGEVEIRGKRKAVRFVAAGFVRNGQITID